MDFQWCLIFNHLQHNCAVNQFTGTTLYCEIVPMKSFVLWIIQINTDTVSSELFLFSLHLMY